MRSPVMLLAILFGFAPALAQVSPPLAEISADLGACSALLTVTGPDGKPVYSARVTARVQYGMMGVKKLDLEAFTGADGRLKIVRLPDSLKKPLVIHVGKDSLQEVVEFKPEERCHAEFDVHLH